MIMAKPRVVDLDRNSRCYNLLLCICYCDGHNVDNSRLKAHNSNLFFSFQVGKQDFKVNYYNSM